MPTSRAFTYATTAAPAGTTRTGDLWVGPTTDQNIRFDLNYSGKIWWMGPNEDGRYIIGKDVPASNWPSKGNTPPYPHDSGSVRFWGTNSESDAEFVVVTNGIRADFSLPPVSDASSAYNWLKDSGYWTNYPPSFEELGTFYTYQTPNGNTGRALGVLYSTSNNILFINTDNQGGDTIKTYGNFYIPNWTTELSTVISGSTHYYSGSSYTSQWLPTGIKTNGDRLTTGFMALDETNDYLFVRTIDVGDKGARGIMKYDISTNPATIAASSSIDISLGDFSKIEFEPSSNSLISTNGADGGGNNNKAWVYDASDLSFQGYLVKSGGGDIKPARYATSGPSGIVMLTQENTTNYYIYNLNAATNPYRAISNGTLNSNYLIERDQAQPVYVASKNKWYLPYRKQNRVNSGQSAAHSVDVIDGSTYSRTTYNYGSQTNSKSSAVSINDPNYFLYDSTRDYFWTIAPVDGTIIAIDADTFTTQVTTQTKGKVVGQQQSAVLVDDKIILIRPDSNNPIKVFDLSDF